MKITLRGQELVDAVDSRLAPGKKIGDICRELKVPKSRYSYWRVKLGVASTRKTTSTPHQVIEVAAGRTELAKVRRLLILALQELEAVNE